MLCYDPATRESEHIYLVAPSYPGEVAHFGQVSETEAVLFGDTTGTTVLAQLFGYESLDDIREALGVSDSADHELAVVVAWGYGKGRLRCAWHA